MRLNYDQLTKIWRASASDSHLTREDLSSVEIDGVTNALLESSSAMTLRAEGHFVYGISQIWNSKTKILLQDSRATDENIGTAFREYLESLSQSSLYDQAGSSSKRRAVATADLDLPDVLDLPQSLLSGRPNRAGDGDISIDNVMRDGDEDMVDELAEGDILLRSAEDQAELEDLNFEIDEGGPAGGDAADLDGPGNLDFGSDLPYSSSPPHTPRGDEELAVQINGGSSPQVREVTVKAKTRQRRAPIDDVISIARPRKVLPKILRTLPASSNSLHDEFHSQDFASDSYIPLDEETEKLVDPDYVRKEMKRRRQVESGEIDNDENEADESVEFGNLDLDENDLDFGDLSNNVDSSDEEEEDTPEMLEVEQRKAHDAIKQSLRRKGDTFVLEDLGRTAKSRACILMEVLSLAARGRVEPVQDEAWGPISVTKV